MKRLFIFFFLSIVPFFSDGNEHTISRLNSEKESQRLKDLKAYLKYKKEQNQEKYLLMN
jgi:hypothetical protein